LDLPPALRLASTLHRLEADHKASCLFAWVEAKLALGPAFDVERDTARSFGSARDPSVRKKRLAVRRALSHVEQPYRRPDRSWVAMKRTLQADYNVLASI
jgi:hypothetical protein